MNSEEKIRLIQLLCSSGVTFFKCAEFELRIDTAKAKEVQKPTMVNANYTPEAQEPAPQYNPQQTDKVLKLIDMLKSGDDELMNKIFPAGAM